MKSAWLALLAACGSSSPAAIDGPPGAIGAPPRDAPVTSASGRWVLGYYVGYQIDTMPIASIPWPALTHIAFAPMLVKADLTLDLTFYDAHGNGMDDARKLSADAHANHVVPLLMLGGANAGANIRTAANAANRAAFVDKLLRALDELHYDGLDLDWEDSVDLDELVALAQDLRIARPAIVLTYPAGSINGNFQTVDARFRALGAAIDQFNVQTYYPSTAITGQGWDSWFLAPLSGVTRSTPIAVDDTLARYAAVGIPKAKLGMGTGFYAICYTGGITGPRQPTTSDTQIVGGDNDFPLTAFYAAGGTYDTHAAARRRDFTAKQPYLSFTEPLTDAHCGQPTQYISYEDETSIADKGAFAKQNGYGGIIVWTLQEGYLPAGASGGRARDAMIQALGTAFLR